MGSRRPLLRQNRGRIATGVRRATPLTIIDAASVVGWWPLYMGVTLGGTLKATGTTPPVVTMTGSTAAQAAPRIEITPDATHFRYAANNGAAAPTWIESNVAIPAGNYAAIGDLAGITFNFPAGPYATDNVYQATIAMVADQSPNGNHFTQITPAFQPIFWLVDPLNNNRPAAVFDGVDDFMNSLMAIPAPATTRRQHRRIYRLITWTASAALQGGNAGTCQQVLCAGVTPRLSLYSGSAVSCDNTHQTVGSPYRMSALFTGSANDRLSVGNTVSSPNANVGNTTATSFNIGYAGAAGTYSNHALHDYLLTNRAITAAEEAALTAYDTAFYTAAVFA